MRRIVETGSELKLNADDLKKEILLVLMNANKFNLMQMLGRCTDASKLSRILALINAGEFDKASEYMQT